MKTESMAIAVFKSHEDAEHTVKTLEQEGFDMKKLSILGKGYNTEEQVVGYVNTGDRIKTWGKYGAFWGGIFGAFFGSGLFFIPTFGNLFIAGPILVTLMGALEDATYVGGLSIIGAALMSIGIPKNSVVKYEAEIKADKFLLIVHGTSQEINRAKESIKDIEEVLEPMAV